MENKEIDKKCEKIIEKLFFDINKTFQLKTGDISPEQVLQVEEFIKLITCYVRQNK